MNEKIFIIATNNQHKLVEFRRIFDNLSIKCMSLSEAGICCEPREDGTTFEQNAMIKAQCIYNACGVPVIADDSGLSVDALNGEPGVYSARYGGEGISDFERIEHLLINLADLPLAKRSAHFTAVIACIIDKEKSFCVKGEVEGTIINEPIGENGFGYDPIFVPKGYDKTFAQLSPAVKDSISHRARALAKFAEIIKSY